jgi:hypothetical protein
MSPRLVLLLSCAACASVPTAAPTELPTQGAGVLKAISCGAVTAQWLGKPADEGPALYGAESLEFTVPGGAVLPFKPTGSLNFSDWSSEVFSPGCGWVLLLQDRFGPYHLVKLERLAAYLGGGPADAVVETRTPSGEAQVHSEQLWRAPDTFEYFASLGGDVAVVRGKVAKPELRAVIFETKDAPKGIRRTADGFEAVR